MLNKLTVKLFTEDKEVKGSFRGLVTAHGKDIIVLGNKKSSILFCMADIDVTEVYIEEILELSGQVTSEYHTPKTKQAAYSMLMRLYAEYRIGRVIDTEEFETEAAYISKYTDRAMTNTKSPIWGHEDSTWPPWEDEDLPKPPKKDVPTVVEPMVTKSEKMTDYLNKILKDGVVKQGNWKQKYKGQM